ncbi:hypothetical protein NL676_009561 [Syzygium grande]|nr:hypothetical protein NL676_009561 [Syzygium grande]
MDAREDDQLQQTPEATSSTERRPGKRLSSMELRRQSDSTGQNMDFNGLSKQTHFQPNLAPCPLFSLTGISPPPLRFSRPSASDRLPVSLIAAAAARLHPRSDAVAATAIPRGRSHCVVTPPCRERRSSGPASPVRDASIKFVEGRGTSTGRGARSCPVNDPYFALRRCSCCDFLAGLCEQALIGCCETQDNGVLPDNFMVPNPLRACGALMWIGFDEGVDGYVEKMGPGGCVFVASSLIDFYGERRLS